MPVYYNEFDPKKAAWLRELIKVGVIANGEVDERSIELVQPDDLRGFAQCHFFAGIGIWSYALRLAGWEDSREVWSFSCPCQPFSAAGKKKGFADRRHLFPEQFRLIRERRPVVCFGEQVSSPDGLAWLDNVRDHMEGEAYTFGAVDLCAAGAGAPHIRNRTFFVADTESIRRRRGTDDINARRRECPSGQDGASERLGDSNGSRSQGWGIGRDSAGERAIGAASVAGGLEDSETADERRRAGPVNGFWRDAGWVLCRPERSDGDPSWRPVEPRTFPLVAGATDRVGRLRGYGDGIVAPVAAEFIKAYLETQTKGEEH